MADRAARAAAAKRVAAFRKQRDEAALEHTKPKDFDQAGFDALRARAKERGKPRSERQAVRRAGSHTSIVPPRSQPRPVAESEPAVEAPSQHDAPKRGRRR